MPILNDILDHEVLGREYKRGRLEGRLEGSLEGEQRLLRRQMESRFGPIPAWADERLLACSADDLEKLGIRLLGATTLDDLFRGKP